MNLYKWEQLPEEAMPSLAGDVLRRFVGGVEVTVGRVSFSEGAETEPHRHANEQFSLVLSGRLEFTIEGKSVVVATGEVLHLRPHELHGAKALEASVVIDVFSPPRADWGPPPASRSE